MKMRDQRRATLLLLFLLVSFVSSSFVGDRNLKRSYETMNPSSDSQVQKRQKNEKETIFQTVTQEMIEKNSVDASKVEALLKESDSSLQLKKLLSNVYSFEYLDNFVQSLPKSTVDSLKDIAYLNSTKEMQEPLLTSTIRMIFERQNLTNDEILAILKSALIQRYFKLVQTIAKEYFYLINDDFLSFLVDPNNHPMDDESYAETVLKIFNLVPAYVSFYSTDLLMIMIQHKISNELTDRIFEMSDCSVFDVNLLKDLIFGCPAYSRSSLGYFSKCYPNYEFPLPGLNQILASNDYEMITGLIESRAFSATSLEDFNAKPKSEISSLKSIKSVLSYCRQHNIVITKFFTRALKNFRFSHEEKDTLIKEFINQFPDFSGLPLLLQGFYVASTAQDSGISSKILTEIVEEIKGNGRCTLILKALFRWDQGWAMKSIKSLLDEVNDMKKNQLMADNIQRIKFLTNILLESATGIINSDVVTQPFLAEFLITNFQGGGMKLFGIAERFNMVDKFWGHLQKKRDIPIPKEFYKKVPLNMYFSLTESGKASFILFKLFEEFKERNKHVVHETVSSLVLADLLKFKQNYKFILPDIYRYPEFYKALENNSKEVFKHLVQYIKSANNVFTAVKIIESTLDPSGRSCFGIFAIEFILKCTNDQRFVFSIFSQQTVEAYLYISKEGRLLASHFINNSVIHTVNYPSALASSPKYHLNFLINTFCSETDLFLEFAFSKGNANLLFLDVPLQTVYEHYLSVDKKSVPGIECLLSFFVVVMSEFIEESSVPGMMFNLSETALRLEKYAWIFTESVYDGTQAPFWSLLADYQSLSPVLIRDLLTTTKEAKVLKFMENFYLKKDEDPFWKNYFPKEFEQRLFEASLYKNHLNVAKFLQSKNPNLFVPIEYANKEIQIDCDRISLRDLSKLRLQRVENQFLQACINEKLYNDNGIDLKNVPVEFLHLALKAAEDPAHKLDDFLTALFARMPASSVVNFVSQQFVCQSKTIYASVVCPQNSGNLTTENEISTVLCSEMTKVFPQHPILQSCQSLIRMPQNEANIDKKQELIEKVINKIIQIDIEDDHSKLFISINNENQEALLNTSIESFKKIDTYKFRVNVPSIVYTTIGLQNDYQGVSRDWNSRIVDLLLSRNFKQVLTGLIPINHFDSFESKSLFDSELELLGKVLGLALKWKITAKAPFPTFIWKLIMGFEIENSDVRELDTEFFDNLMKDGVEEAGFAFEDGISFQDRIFELEGHGLVDSSNVAEFRKQIFSIIKNHYTNLCQPLVRGFNEIVPKTLIRILKPSELQLLISGKEEIDVIDWKNNTRYKNCSADDPTIQYFWEVVEEMTIEERKLLLKFVHGSDRLPKDGFKALMGFYGTEKFRIRLFGDETRFPSSHTCFNRLDLPKYSSKEMLKNRLFLAMTESQLTEH